MSVHFLVALLGALLATAGSGMLAVRYARSPGVGVAFWGVAMLGLTVALFAQAAGFGAGFGPDTFRLMEIGAQVVAPIALLLGLIEVVARSLLPRFAARLVLSALAFVTMVVLATDPLSSSATFSKAWPAPATFYQPIPNGLLTYLLPPVTLLVALIGGGIAAARQGRDEHWAAAFPPAGVAAVSAILLSVPGLAALLKTSLPMASLFVVLCILAVAGTWFAGLKASGLHLDATRAGADGRARRPDEPAGFGPAASDEFGIYRPEGSRRGGDASYRDDSGYEGRGAGRAPYPDDALYRDPGRQDRGYGSGTGFREDTGFGDSTGSGGNTGFREEAGYAGDHAGYPDEAHYPDRAGYPPEGGYPGGPPYSGGEYSDHGEYASGAGYEDVRGPARPDASAPMFGQIAIYTLLEDRVQDFDRLTQQVVALVQAHEPDTLVYIVHAVPSAPMQRILYEVYRDRDGYEQHRRQPYVMKFEADRRPYVLATNVIELGLQQAKVSPLPSLTDLLHDTGFDLLSDTGFGYPGYGPRRNPRHGGGIPDGGRAGRPL